MYPILHKRPLNASVTLMEVEAPYIARKARALIIKSESRDGITFESYRRLIAYILERTELNRCV